jgi:hypothetical protein
MRSGGSNQRPPNPPRGPGGYWTPGVGRMRQPQPRKRSVNAAAKAGWPLWRRLRQRIRATWRWVIIRTVRGLTARWGSREDRPDAGAQSCEVKPFPQSSRWP